MILFTVPGPSDSRARGGLEGVEFHVDNSSGFGSLRAAASSRPRDTQGSSPVDTGPYVDPPGLYYFVMVVEKRIFHLNNESVRLFQLRPWLGIFSSWIAEVCT